MKKIIINLLAMYSLVFASDNIESKVLSQNEMYNAESVVASQEETYRSYIQGSISGIYTVPVSDAYTGLVEESYADALSKANIDLLLLQKYYGGLYIGYEFSLDNNAVDYYVEKRIGVFGLKYRNVTSQYDATPKSRVGVVTFTDFNDNSQAGQNGKAKSINYSYDKIELKYYGDENIKDRGWFSIFYEKIKTGTSGEETPLGSGNINYYTNTEIENYAFYFGAEQLDYMMDDGFDISKIGASMGVATINQTDSIKYENGDLQYSFGLNLEMYYKKSFTQYSSVIFAVQADLVKISGLLEYGTIGARLALTF